MFTGLGPHRELQTHQYLLEQQHSKAQAVQEVSGVHSWLLPDTDDQGANDGRHSAGPHTYKQRTGQGCEASFGSNLGCSDCKTVRG